MIRKITKRQWKTFLFIALIIILLYIILPISLPLVIAFLTALMLNPIVRWIQSTIRLGRKSSVIIVFLLFLVITGVAGTYIVIKAVAQVVNFVEDVPAYLNLLNQVYQHWEDVFRQYANNLPPEFVKQVTTSIQENLTSIIDRAKDIITIDNISQIVSKVPQYLISFLVYIIALFLVMLELPIIKSKGYNLLSESTAKKVSFMSERLSNVIIGFFKAQFLVSLIIFSVSLIGLLIIVPEVAIIMALVIWIIDLIPIIGSIIILAPWALFMFLSGNSPMGIQLSILAVILLAIRRIVEPKVMGKHIGLSPLATLIAMFLGVKLLGVMGIILGPLIVIAFHSAKEAEIISINFKI
ncbi:sporulation integral membrane protein YtvI [Virgibacillus soli]|uniref:Sporulation integral membrane protein YtvI n=1 Tax=Paracerasibacillus soli TaxID=480284 RepID=A0ABU5CNZ2_9BACI|nr:sporulation integral membrane protein YtvI [Virgibacillus soli]MDY0408077.1 sporulation integral membrane protein YtvI [Virgibacillus soli]